MSAKQHCGQRYDEHRLSRALHMHIMFLYTARYSAGSKFVGHKSSFREQSRMHIAAGRSKDFLPILWPSQHQDAVFLSQAEKSDRDNYACTDLWYAYCVGACLQHNLRPFTSRETLFKRFIDLIESTYPKPRSVSYYAERLNVTPKYFSYVCKQAVGQKATGIIDQYVVKDIVYMMNHTQKSIKEIACELDFPNLSFFGKYVKKHLGVSPKNYREQAIKRNANNWITHHIG